MDTKIEDSNLAYIGSDEDKAAKLVSEILGYSSIWEAVSLAL